MQVQRQYALKQNFMKIEFFATSTGHQNCLDKSLSTIDYLILFICLVTVQNRRKDTLLRLLHVSYKNLENSGKTWKSQGILSEIFLSQGIFFQQIPEETDEIRL